MEHQVHVETQVKPSSGASQVHVDQAAEHQVHEKLLSVKVKQHQTAEHQVHLEMQMKIKQRSIKFIQKYPSEDLAAEHQVHVEMQVKIKQRSINFM